MKNTYIILNTTKTFDSILSLKKVYLESATHFIANVVEVLLLLLLVSSLPKIFHSICPIFSLSVCNLLKNLRHSEEIESIMSPFPLNSFELLSCNHYCRLMPSKSSSAADKMNSF